MKSIDVGWATFYNDVFEDFSPEFQREMSNQLMIAFNAMVGIENFASDKKFMLFVGMIELKTMYKDGYAFSLVEVIAPNSFSKSLTVFWKAKDNQKIVKSNSVNSQNIKFGWCSDFDKEFFKSFAKENVIKTIKDIELNFKYVTDFERFPDLNVMFQFIQLPDSLKLDRINNLLRSCFKESYISGLSEKDGRYSSMIDFQGTDFNSGVNQIDQFILELNSSDSSKFIQSITIN